MSAKEQVVVLHLSDLHFGWEGDENGRTDRNLALNGLLRLLDKLQQSWKPDCVCISGDIGWGGRPNDYKDAKIWIEQLLGLLKLSSDALLMCPGNHDADRNVAQGNARPTSPDEADRVLGIPIKDHYEKPFEAYIEFCKTMRVPPYALGPKASYLVGLRSFQGINFVAYNSAWSSKDKHDEGKLWLGLPHIRYMEGQGQLPNPQQINKWPPTVAFFHHPYEWFHQDERHAWGQRPNTFDYMARRCHLFLTGHIHAEARDADLVGGGAWHLDGGAAFAGASHFNFFRIVQVKADRFVYRSFVYEPSSPDNVWQEKGEEKPLPFNALGQKGNRKDSPAPSKGKKGKEQPVARGTEDGSRVQNEPEQSVELKVARSQSSSAQTGVFDWDVFISYSHSDSDIATRIRTELGNRGVRVWLDTEQILPGDLPVSKMEDGLDRSSAVAILVSPASVTSGWVEEEYSRAISLTKRTDHPVRVIPVLIKKATLPGFLANRSWVDFQDAAVFDASLALLVKGIKPPANSPAGLEVARLPENLWLAKMSFLWFFPEGMLAGLYRHLVAEMGLQTVHERAETEGLVRPLNTQGPNMMGADTEHVRELRDLIKDPTKIATELLLGVKRWVDESGVFDEVSGLGIGRTLLIRDLLALAQYVPDEGDREYELKDWACQLGRAYLPQVAEQYLRIAVEISRGLLEAHCVRTGVDNLMLAHLLLRIGEARQAADLFDVYRSTELFDQFGLDESERFNFALDWAKASKDAGRARVMHAELVEAYDQMLALLRKIEPGNEEESQRLKSSEADVLNNRATQIAQFGEDKEWSKAQKSFAAACEIYERVGDGEKLLAARANFVAQTLDRFDRQKIRANENELRPLLTSLEKLDPIASKSDAGENLFFFLYQRARLVKRLYPDEPEQAIDYYKQAAEVTEQAGMPHRSAIARCWELHLLERAGKIGEDDYLKGLRQCAVSLREHVDDAWASNALGNTLLDVARILRNRGATAEAWSSMVEAFELEARRPAWSQSSTAPSRLKEVLEAMNGLKPDEDKRASFLEKNAQLLKRLTNTPNYKKLGWSLIAEWLKR